MPCPFLYASENSIDTEIESVREELGYETCHISYYYWEFFCHLPNVFIYEIVMEIVLLLLTATFTVNTVGDKVLKEKQ